MQISTSVGVVQAIMVLLLFDALSFSDLIPTYHATEIKETKIPAACDTCALEIRGLSAVAVDQKLSNKLLLPCIV